MAKGKGYKCPECGNSTGKYSKGAYQCGNSECGAVWWSVFDRPSAGVKRKGYKCISCGNQTVHPVTTVASAKIWRRSICGSTIVAAV